MLWDNAGRLVVCNDRYLAMYGISPGLAKPGTALIDIIRHRVVTGSLHRDPVQYCVELLETIAAGEVISFVTEMPDGAPFRSTIDRYPAAAIGSGPMTTSQSVVLRNGKAPRWESRRHAAAPSLMRPSRGFAKVSGEFGKPLLTALRP